MPKGATPVLGAMRAELDHSLAALKTQPVPPYFVSYQITEVQSVYVASAFGALEWSSATRTRALDVDLRVGDYALDNTHPLRGGRGPTSDRLAGSTPVPIEDGPDAIRAVLWYQTDRKYKQAVEQLTKVKTNVTVKVDEEDKSADFCAGPVQTFAEAPLSLALDRKVWEQKTRKYTAPFARYGNLYSARAVLSAEIQTRWYVNSEGTLLQTSRPGYRLSISASTKADDGMDLPRSETFFATRADELPSDTAVLALVTQMAADLQALRVAPVVDPYTGPAILSGRAGGVFFHEIFGHRVEGHRQKKIEEGQTFKKKLGEAVLPEMFTVYSDPTQERFGSTSLGGYYLYDDEGIKARRVNLIEKGVFKGFLMARMPIEGFPESNGHGRKQVGSASVSRQANLVVQAAAPVSRAALKQQLLAMLKEQGKPFGLFFDDIQGGFTLTGRTTPNAFNVLPILVYRIYADGREELVRGVDLIGTPLATFSKIVAADDSPAVFNGVCGAESGWVPVSAISPGLLISQIEVQKKEKSQERLPLLPAPLGASEAQP
jgi:TldD protein